MMARPRRRSLGGKARAVKMTPEERSEAARKVVAKRWAKSKIEGESGGGGDHLP